MGNWEWILPVLLGIWFLINLIRKADEERRSREKAAAGDRPAPRPRRPPPEDIDRFLEEVNRRRRQSTERRPGTEGPRPVVAVPAPAPPVRPRPSPRPQPTRQPPPRQPAPAVAEVVVAVPAEIPVIPAPQWAPPPGPGTPQPAAGEGKAKAAPVSLGMLLRAPQNLRNAILLREILDPPLCRRRR
jgi:hypothetical protein